jgi:hypothetical protein
VRGCNAKTVSCIAPSPSHSPKGERSMKGKGPCGVMRNAIIDADTASLQLRRLYGTVRADAAKTQKPLFQR